MKIQLPNGYPKVVSEIIAIISVILTESWSGGEDKNAIRISQYFYRVLNGHCCYKRVITDDLHYRSRRFTESYEKYSKLLTDGWESLLLNNICTLLSFTVDPCVKHLVDLPRKM